MCFHACTKLLLLRMTQTRERNNMFAFLTHLVCIEMIRDTVPKSEVALVKQLGAVVSELALGFGKVYYSLVAVVVVVMVEEAQFKRQVCF